MLQDASISILFCVQMDASNINHLPSGQFILHDDDDDDDITTIPSVSHYPAFCSDRPSAWCKDNWIHWRALKSAFSVETQLREILLRLHQVQQFTELL